MIKALLETELGELEEKHLRRVQAPGGERGPGIFQKGQEGSQQVQTYFKVSPGNVVCSLVASE